MKKVNKAISEKTKRILLKVIDYIEQEPKRLDMSAWGTYFPKEWKKFAGVDEVLQPVPPCGTTACIGGTCLLVTKAGMNFLHKSGSVKEMAEQDECVIQFPSDSDEAAAKILGITEEQASRLFFFSEWRMGDPGWPARFVTRYKKAKSAKGRFNATRDRILHFINTGL